MKHLLITGGSGFIGRNLVEYFSDGYIVHAPTHRELELLDKDAVFQYVVSNKIDIIIHAAIHVPMFNGLENEYNNDLNMFANISACSKCVEKIIYFGSGAEYDKTFDIEMVTEEQIGEHIPTSAYGLAKFQMNAFARKSENIYNLRLFGVFGKYELWQIKFLSNICCKAIFDLPLTIRKDCYFDYLYIDDLCTVVEWFISNHPKRHDYNVCLGRQYLLTQYADKIISISGKRLHTQLLSQERGLNYSGNNNILCQEIPSLSRIDIDNRLEKLYNYYINHRSLIDLTILKDTK